MAVSSQNHPPPTPGLQLSYRDVSPAPGAELLCPQTASFSFLSLWRSLLIPPHAPACFLTKPTNYLFRLYHHLFFPLPLILPLGDKYATHDMTSSEMPFSSLLIFLHPPSSLSPPTFLKEPTLSRGPISLPTSKCLTLIPHPLHWGNHISSESEASVRTCDWQTVPSGSSLVLHFLKLFS